MTKSPDKENYSNRNEYRKVTSPGLISFCVQHRETELLICAESALQDTALGAVLSLRKILDDYINKAPAFLKSLNPVDALPGAHNVIVKMCEAGRLANVGPMASVAGAFAEYAGEALLKHSARVIVENGGDIYMYTGGVGTTAIYAGNSPLSMKIGVEADTRKAAVSVCASSGTVGPSLSFGKADAAVVISRDACLADACATRLGNELKTPGDIKHALETVCAIRGVLGAVAIMGDKCGAMGDIKLNSL